MNTSRILRYGWPVVLLATMCLMAGTPTQVMAQQSNTGMRCFNETNYCISGRIRQYWEQNGGLMVFGFPTGPQQQEWIEGRPYQVQWFERHRLELHPENRAPYDVLLGRLGAQRLVQSGSQSPAEAPVQNCFYFDQTRLNVCGRFLEAWRADGLEFDGRAGKSYAESLALFGLPLTNEQSYQGADGRMYQVQWFERARFEHHPENERPYDVLFGLLGNEMMANPPSVSPGEITFVSNRDGNDEIYVMKSDGSQQRRLTYDKRSDGAPQWSPDNTKIAFIRNESDSISPHARFDIYVMNADGTDQRRVTAGVAGVSHSFSWSPDSSKLAVHVRVSDIDSNLVVVNADGTNPITIAGSPDFDDLQPAWSPDGQRIAFLSDRDGTQYKLYAMNTDGSNPVKLANEVVFHAPEWMPDSKGVVYAQDRDRQGIFYAAADGSGSRVLLETTPGFETPKPSPDGRMIAYQTVTRDSQNVPIGGSLWIMGSDGLKPGLKAGTDLAPDRVAAFATWSPDNKQLAFTESCFQATPQSPCTVDTNIVRIDATGENQRLLTQRSGRNFQPDWQN